MLVNKSLKDLFPGSRLVPMGGVVPLGLLVVDLSMVTHVNPTFGPYKDQPSMWIHRYQSNG